MLANRDRLLPLLFLSSSLLWMILAIPTINAHWPHDVIDAVASSSDGTEVFVVARKALLHSMDSGSSWRVIRQLEAYKPYMARSPHQDGTLYVHDGGTTMLRSTDLVHWDVAPIDGCQKYHHTIMLNRIVFSSSGALISGNGKIYKEDTTSERGFTETYYGNYGFGYCPALAAVPSDDTVYAGGVDGLLKSTDGGSTWSLIIPMNEEILQLELRDGELFAMTQSRICRVVHKRFKSKCKDIKLPGLARLEKSRKGSSHPTDLAYTDGALIVTRANSRSVYRTTDFGKTWQYRSLNDGDFPTDGHFPPEQTAWVFQGGEEFTCIDRGYLCSWTGLFRTVDGGNSWKSRNTLRRSIVNFSIIKELDQFTVTACGYSVGCFHGSPTNLQPHQTLSNAADYPMYYDSLALSPTYHTDGIGFENTGAGLYRLDGTKVMIESINGFSPFIKGVIFPPNFSNSGTMFVYGYNIGVLVSRNQGATFGNIFDGYGFPGVVKLVLSPTFHLDGTMACLVDPNYDPNDPWKESTDMHVYVTQNYGVRWRRLVWQANPYRDIIIVAGDPVPTVVVVHENGQLYGHTSDLSAGWFAFEEIAGTVFPQVRPQGFYRGGLAVSPDGKTLAAAFAEGGVMYGEINLNKITDIRFSNPDPLSNTKMAYIPAFVHNPPGSADIHGRVLSSHIAFSPDYHTDGTMFATDLLCIYTSTDRGYTWSKVFEFKDEA